MKLGVGDEVPSSFIEINNGTEPWLVIDADNKVVKFDENLMRESDDLYANAFSAFLDYITEGNEFE